MCPWWFMNFKSETQRATFKGIATKPHCTLSLASIASRLVLGGSRTTCDWFSGSAHPCWDIHICLESPLNYRRQQLMCSMVWSSWLPFSFQPFLPCLLWLTVLCWLMPVDETTMAAEVLIATALCLHCKPLSSTLRGCLLVLAPQFLAPVLSGCWLDSFLTWSFHYSLHLETQSINRTWGPSK